MTAPIVGARTVTQLEDKLGALEVRLDDGQLDRLEAAGAVERGFPHDFLDLPMTRQVMFGEVTVQHR